MIRTSALAGLLVLLATADAQAGPFGWRLRAAQPVGPDCCQPAPRFPRLAAIAQPPGFMLPGYFWPNSSDRPLLRGFPYALAVVFNVMTFLSPSYDVIGLGVPPAIRAAHVLLNGSPTPGRPFVTAGWIASPAAVQGVMWVRMRRTGIVPGIDYPTNPSLSPYNTPLLIRRTFGLAYEWAE